MYISHTGEDLNFKSFSGSLMFVHLLFLALGFVIFSALSVGVLGKGVWAWFKHGETKDERTQLEVRNDELKRMKSLPLRLIISVLFSLTIFTAMGVTWVYASILIVKAADDNIESVREQERDDAGGKDYGQIYLLLDALRAFGISFACASSVAMMVIWCKLIPLSLSLFICHALSHVSLSLSLSPLSLHSLSLSYPHPLYLSLGYLCVCLCLSHSPTPSPPHRLELLHSPPLSNFDGVRS